jgi:RES domain-containing protein
VESQGNPCDLRGSKPRLCALEVLANVNELPDDYVVTPIDVPDNLAVIAVPEDGLPPGWNAARPITETADIGRAWADRLESVVLVVPSAVIAQEQNYILNPRHSDFSRLRFLTPEPFHFDDRLRRVWLKR